MVKIKIIWLFSVMVFISGLVSCTNTQTRNKDKHAENYADSMDPFQLNNESIVYLLPLPGEILQRFYNSDLPYRPELLNSPKNKDKYIGSTAQSLNLGVFITDMAYSALFERSTETVNYLEAIQSLTAEAGISSTIFASLLERSKTNSGNIDSLVNISNEAFSNMLEFLETGGNEKTISRLSAGAYIESLYIALHSIDKYNEENELLELLIEMRYPMDNLLERVKSSAVTDNDISIINYLNQISGLFNELGKEKSKTIISQKQTGVISIQGGDQIILNETNYNILKNEVSEIRKSIVDF